MLRKLEDGNLQPVIIEFDFAVKLNKNFDKKGCGTPGFIAPELFGNLEGDRKGF